MSRTISADNAVLLVIDFQMRLMPAIENGAEAVTNASRLIRAAHMIDVPVRYTEQNPKGLGVTVSELAATPAATFHKMTFDASRTAGFDAFIAKFKDVIVTGCEAHVCVLQTVLGLLDSNHRVFVVEDAIGSRRGQNKQAALARMSRHGAEIVTTEMVIFEWLASAEHPHFREAVALIK
eukprot:gene13381-13497_t